MTTVNPEDISTDTIKEILEGADTLESLKKKANEAGLSDDQIEDVVDSFEPKNPEASLSSEPDYPYILEVEKLPSQGLVYDFDEIFCRGIKVKEMKNLDLVDQTQNLRLFHDSIRQVMQSCTNIDIKQITMGDEIPLYLFLRFNTWPEGEIYKFNYTCAHCDKLNPNYRYDLTSLSYNELEDDYEDPMEFEIEDRLFKFRILRVGDLIEIERFMDNHGGRYKNEMNEQQLYKLAHYACMIKEASDLQGMTINNKIHFIENEMTVEQFTALRAFADRYTHDINTRVEVECNFCGRNSYTKFPFSANLFYPRSSDIIDLNDFRI